MNPAKTVGAEGIDELRAFLLGNLADTEAERVEYSLLSNDRLYELLLATEEELIDEYLSGALSRSEASRFLGYLNKLPGGRTRIDLARVFKESLGAPDTPAASWRSAWGAVRGLARRPAWAAALVLFLGFGIYVSIESREPAPLVLSAGMTRSEGEIPTATLSASARTFRVVLDLGVHSHDRYRATLYDADSRATFSSEGLTANVTENRILVAFPIPAAELEPGDYSISLEGESPSAGYEPLERYVFRLLE